MFIYYPTAEETHTTFDCVGWLVQLYLGRWQVSYLYDIVTYVAHTFPSIVVHTDDSKKT